MKQLFNFRTNGGQWFSLFKDNKGKFFQGSLNSLNRDEVSQEHAENQVFLELNRRPNTIKPTPFEVARELFLKMNELQTF
tara:strand:- start:1787 stop:2026 length:240 start_codon:yes stop_codon:yes gene_type:complete